jgi:iron-sulfur cluster assembly accessory protein
MINLTETAAAEFKRLMSEQGLSEAVVRIGVESGGCSGLQYSMDFDETVKDDDTVFEQPGGLKVVCDQEQLVYVDGLEVDFSKKLMGGGFRFANPNAAKSCGCGTSFRI